MEYRIDYTLLPGKQGISPENLRNSMEVYIGIIGRRGMPGYELKVDDAMRFYKEHTKNIRSEKKYSTLRAAENAIRIPGALQMPWIETSRKNPRNGPRIGTLEMTRVIVSPIEELTEGDLAHDGWEDHDHIIEGIQSIWGFEAQYNSIVSLYFFKPV